MSNRLLLLVLLGTATASAQSPTAAVDPALCDRLAAMPSAPMSVDACKSMMDLAVDDPSAHRPGDDVLTCGQIFAELSAHAPAGVTADEAARHEALVQQAATMNERHARRNAAESAPEAAALQAASVLPAPLAAPIVAGAQASLKKKSAVATDRYLTETRQVTAGSAAIIEQKLGHDPRLSRLSQLAATKQCSPPEY